MQIHSIFDVLIICLGKKFSTVSVRDHISKTGCRISIINVRRMLSVAAAASVDTISTDRVRRAVSLRHPSFYSMLLDCRTLGVLIAKLLVTTDVE